MKLWDLKDSSMETAKGDTTEVVLSEVQTGIMDHIVDHSVSIIAGPAGTGKSTMISVLIACLEEAKLYGTDHDVNISDLAV